MAGRGWSKTTFSQDQLQALGVTGMDMPPVILEPPPTYPMLSSKPQPFEENEEIAYAFKKNLEISNERHKSQCRQANTVKYHYLIRNACNYDYRDITYDFAWSNLPEELGPGRAKRNKKVRKITQIQDKDIVERLKDLEKKEELDGAVEVERKRDNSEELREEEDEAEEENQLHTDDEYDDDNDYGNSYFDNGEAYDDNADEPLDDGPIF